MTFPDNLKYTKDHEWLLIEGDRVTIGITPYAQEALGDMVFVDLPDVGATFHAGACFAVAESVKAASEIYTPLAGEVVEVNTNLEEHPELLNADPMGAGWIVKMIISNPEPRNRLLRAAEYAEFVDGLV